ncbi:MAG: hypothetical protein HY922_13110 [Elusimicrobia bacterium]|nr:hypothetical protein [Elusimicrobiota bacterium]
MAVPRWAPAALLLACAAAALCLPVLNPDVFWHLSAGRWMLEHRAFPHADWLSFTMAGRPWVDFEWLTQLLFYAAFSLGGLGGLWALKLLVFTAGAALLWPSLGLYGTSASGRAVGMLAWVLGISTANDLRPENFSLVFFLALWFYLERRRLKGPSLHKGAYEVIAVAAFFALWANLHAGFVYGLILLGICALADFAKRRALGLPALLPIAAAAALLNPYGPAVYRVLWEHYGALAELKTYIFEWQDPTLQASWLWPFWAILLSAYLSVLARYLKSRDVPAEHLACIFLFGLSASAHARTSVYFLSIAVPVTAAALKGLAAGKPRRLLLGAAAAFELAFFAWKVAPELARFDVFQEHYVPAGLTRFLEGERGTLGGKRVFNPWHWGGYLGFKLHPDIRVFVDGRYLFHGLLPRMYAATRTPEDYRVFLDSYGIDIAVLERTRQLIAMPAALKGGGKGMLWRPFYLFFLPKKDWALVYWDSQAMAFVHRSTVPEQWLKTHEFTAFRPEDLKAAQELLHEGLLPKGRLAAEVERFAALSPDPADAAASRAWLKALTEGQP